MRFVVNDKVTLGTVFSGCSSAVTIPSLLCVDLLILVALNWTTDVTKRRNLPDINALSESEEHCMENYCQSCMDHSAWCCVTGWFGRKPACSSVWRSPRTRRREPSGWIVGRDWRPERTGPLRRSASALLHVR